MFWTKAEETEKETRLMAVKSSQWGDERTTEQSVSQWCTCPAGDVQHDQPHKMRFFVLKSASVKQEDL